MSIHPSAIQFDVARLGREARRLAHDQGLDAADPAECGWALLVDAARVWAAMPSPSPRGYPRESAMPDPIRTPAEIFGVERERITDRVRVETDCRSAPDSRSVSRAEEVLALYHPSRFRGAVRQPQRAVRALWVFAASNSPIVVQRSQGVSKSTLYRYRQIMCLKVGRLLR